MQRRSIRSNGSTKIKYDYYSRLDLVRWSALPPTTFVKTYGSTYFAHPSAQFLSLGRSIVIGLFGTAPSSLPTAPAQEVL
jgi:hypothetical protein